MLYALLLLGWTQYTCLSTNWNVGWGFDKYNGLPLIPESVRTYQMNESVVSYFVGNDTGPNNAVETAAEARFGYSGIGWQMEMVSNNYRHLEQSEIKAAMAIKAINPKAKTMVLRNSEVVTLFWDSARKKMEDPSFNSFWVQCNGKPCNGSWDCEKCKGLYKYWLNWTNPLMVDWYLKEYIAPVLSEPSIDGIYFDCSCGNPPGIPSSEQQAFQDAAQEAFDKVLEAISAAGKWASAWLSRSNVGPPSQKNCRNDILHAISIGNLTRNTLQLQYDPTSNNFNQTLATFLLARGASATFQYNVFGAYEASVAESYPWHAEFDIDYGHPLKPAEEVKSGIFERSWTNADIRFDCNAYKAEILIKN